MTILNEMFSKFGAPAQLKRYSIRVKSLISSPKYCVYNKTGIFANTQMQTRTHNTQKRKCKNSYIKHLKAKQS